MATELNIDLGVGDIPEKPFEAPVYKGKPEYRPPYFTINIAHVDHLPEYEVAGVNGEVLQIQRGIDVPNIPEAFIKNLRSCMSSRQVKKKGPDQVEYYEWVPYPAIPFQVVDGPYNERK